MGEQRRKPHVKHGDMPPDVNACLPNTHNLPKDILNALNDAILITDRDGAIHFANAAAEHLFLTSRPLLLKRRLNDVFKDSPDCLSRIKKAIDQRRDLTDYDLRFIARDNSEHHLGVKVGRLQDSEDLSYIQLDSRTIADKINRQIQYLNAAKSAAGAATMLAHEIKNPLSGIKGAAQLLEDNAGDEDKSLAGLIIQEVDRIAELVNTIEDFAGPRTTSFAPVNIHEILDHVVKLAQQGIGKHHKIEQYYDPSLPLVNANKDQMVQVFLNIVKNAIEASSDENSRIQIRTAYSHGIRFQLEAEGRSVSLPIEIKVIDNGCGIDETLKAHLFEPFVTNKVNGKGLGLAWVAKIIGDHGGIVDCHSSNQQTTFKILLPKV